LDPVVTHWLGTISDVCAIVIEVNEELPMTTIALLGTGLMGTGFIQRARVVGLTVCAWNRSAAKAQALAANDAAGVTACATVAEACAAPSASTSRWPTTPRSTPCSSRW
jgi:hypothetical protein